MKDSILLLSAIFFINLSVFSQPCLPEGIFFTTQEEVDSFQINYPNCTEIEGNVLIGHLVAGSDITNLDGLNVITVIGGSLFIQFNEILTDLTGLQNLETIGDNLFIEKNHYLEKLNGLEALTSIGGMLDIQNNEALSALSGLENLTTIGHRINIIDNFSLENLDGLSGVTSIIGGLSISGNTVLADISGIENIEPSSITDLTITYNPMLSYCKVESVCNYLADPQGVVNIYYNNTGCNSASEIAQACMISLPCLPYGNYTMNSQEEIDGFQSNYPDCIELKGDLIIRGEDITNLDGLDIVESVSGAVVVRNCDILADLSGLQNLENTNDDLSIHHNESLTDLSHLSGLASIGNDLYVFENPLLTNLQGLENIDAASIANIYIYDNISLSNCVVRSICDYLVNPTGDYFINGNATGCATVFEIQDGCDTLSVGDIILESTYNISPNPVVSNAVVEFYLSQTSQIEIAILDPAGREMITLNLDQREAGPQYVNLQIGSFTPGIYFCKLKTYEAIRTIKFIKL